MAELADALVLETSPSRGGGATPLVDTMQQFMETLVEHLMYISFTVLFGFMVGTLISWVLGLL